MQLSKGRSRFFSGLFAILPMLFLFPSTPQADVIFDQPSVRIAWNPSPEPDTKGYEVHRATAINGAYANISGSVIQTTSWTDITVTDGNSYYYKLKAVDTCGNASQLSPVSEAAVIRLAGPPGDVYLNQPLVKVSWSPSPEPDTKGYEVYRAATVGGSYAKVSSNLLQATTWTDANVSDGNSYYYKVEAVDTCNNKSQLSLASVAAVIDLTRPIVTATPPAGNYLQPITVVLEANEVSTIYYTTDGTTPTPNSSVYSAPVPISGTATLKYIAVDRASNESPVATQTYTINNAGIDNDNDGYPDALEELMGTDPNNPDSQPGASSLTIEPPAVPVKPGATVQLTVTGTFSPPVGDPVQQDMASLVQYQFDTSLVSVSKSGMITGVAEGVASVYAEQVVDGIVAATSNTVDLTVDATPPSVNTIESRPYDNQGTAQDAGPTPRIPVDTGVVIRVSDPAIGENIGIDEGSIHFLINSAEVAAKLHAISEGDLHELDIAFQNDGTFGFDQTVTVRLDLADMAGNLLSFTESFQVESQTEHQWALDNSPPQSPLAIGDGAIEISVLPEPDAINDELLEGAKVTFMDTELVQPRIGPVDEIPPLDLAAPVGIPLAIEPITITDAPITVVVPVPDAQVEDTNGDGVPDQGLEAYDLFFFSPRNDVLWRNIADASSWTVGGSRKDHYDTVPPCIEIQVTQPVAIQAGGGAATTDPAPDIKANGKDESLSLARGSQLSVTISLAPGNLPQPVDWWILASTSRGLYSYDMATKRWLKRVKPSQQAPLTAISNEEVYLGVPPFGAGNYTLYFAVDDNSDGRLDAAWYDTVNVLVHQ